MRLVVFIIAFMFFYSLMGCSPVCTQKVNGVCFVSDTLVRSEVDEEETKALFTYMSTQLGYKVDEALETYRIAVHLVDGFDENNVLGRYEMSFFGPESIKLLAPSPVLMETLGHEILHMVADKIDGVSMRDNARHDIPEYFGENGLEQDIDLFVRLRKQEETEQ